jgi:hypothetical protein
VNGGERVTVFAARWRPRWNVAVERFAGWSGSAVRAVGRGIPGTVGPLVVSFGLWMAWPPLGVVFAGAVLWVLDRRV